ncbi:hypothetical protein BJV78DRAFT_731242 [Lactifluus subvellereus]|nr:hypothetical protein BJV78DRAFT_731242 [Lactifluus subvellereus]
MLTVMAVQGCVHVPLFSFPSAYLRSMPGLNRPAGPLEARNCVRKKNRHELPIHIQSQPRKQRPPAVTGCFEMGLTNVCLAMATAMRSFCGIRYTISAPGNEGFQVMFGICLLSSPAHKRASLTAQGALLALAQPLDENTSYLVNPEHVNSLNMYRTILTLMRKPAFPRFDIVGNCSTSE